MNESQDIKLPSITKFEKLIKPWLDVETFNNLCLIFFNISRQTIRDKENDILLRVSEAERRVGVIQSKDGDALDKDRMPVKVFR